MKIFCMFPSAYHEGKIPEILKEFNSKIGKKLGELGATKIDYSFCNFEYEYIPTNQTSVTYTKGKGIIKAIHNVAQTPDLVICCDGSGAIPYSHVVDIFSQVMSDSSNRCVMANRCGEKSIPPIRYLIERFEIFLIKSFHNHEGEISDGQCGLWAFRTGKLKVDGREVEIWLTAEGYEIELDLVDEVVSKGVNYAFVDVTLPPREVPSSYKKSDNLLKLNFLLKKNGGLKEKLQKYLQKFETSEEFKSLFSESLRSGWEDYKKTILAIT